MSASAWPALLPALRSRPLLALLLRPPPLLEAASTAAAACSSKCFTAEVQQTAAQQDNNLCSCHQMSPLSRLQRARPCMLLLLL
jgi:hypothetical protein